MTKRRGRPPLEDGERSTSIHVRVPDRVYDETDRKAKEERVSVPELVRRAIDHLLNDGPSS